MYRANATCLFPVGFKPITHDLNNVCSWPLRIGNCPGMSYNKKMSQQQNGLWGIKAMELTLVILLTGHNSKAGSTLSSVFVKHAGASYLKSLMKLIQSMWIRLRHKVHR